MRYSAVGGASLPAAAGHHAQPPLVQRTGVGPPDRVVGEVRKVAREGRFVGLVGMDRKACISGIGGWNIGMSEDRRVLCGGGGAGVVSIGVHRLNPLENLRCARCSAGGTRVMRCARGCSVRVGHVVTLSSTGRDRARAAGARAPLPVTGQCS